MALESLLLSRDPQVIRVLQPTLEKLAIDVEICQGAGSGTEIIFSEKFDAVIVDCDDLQGGVQVLQELRKSPSNRSSIAFAILNGVTTTHKAFELGATFVLQKPVTPLNAMRCLSAGLGLMIRERRRYFRCPAELPVVLTLDHNRELRATTTNISETGMAIRIGASFLSQGASGRVLISLPEHHGTVEAKIECVWINPDGLAGMRFLEMSKSARYDLDNWLEEEIVKFEPPLRRQVPTLELRQ
jgi:CheY-like chemotaxis protein